MTLILQGQFYLNQVWFRNLMWWKIASPFIDWLIYLFLVYASPFNLLSIIISLQSNKKHKPKKRAKRNEAHSLHHTETAPFSPLRSCSNGNYKQQASRSPTCEPRHGAPHSHGGAWEAPPHPPRLRRHHLPRHHGPLNRVLPDPPTNQ